MLNFDMLASGHGAAVRQDWLTAAGAAQIADSLGMAVGPARSHREWAATTSFIRWASPRSSSTASVMSIAAEDKVEFVQPQRLAQAGEIGLEMVAALLPTP